MCNRDVSRSIYWALLRATYRDPVIITSVKLPKRCVLLELDNFQLQQYNCSAVLRRLISGPFTQLKLVQLYLHIINYQLQCLEDSSSPLPNVLLPAPHFLTYEYPRFYRRDLLSIAQLSKVTGAKRGLAFRLHSLQQVHSFSLTVGGAYGKNGLCQWCD